MEVVHLVLQVSIFLALLVVAFVVDFVRADASVDSSSSIVTASEIFTQRDDSHNLYAGGGTRKCISDEHLEPDGTEEVSEILRSLNAAGKPFKLRASRRGFHTPNGFVCPGPTYDAKLAMGENQEGTRNGEPGTLSVTVLLHRMNRVVAVDHARHLLTVEAGMTLQNLADAAVQNGMSIPVGVLPVYGNLTVGGVLAVSAHGTGAGVVSSLGELVTWVKWVDAKGDIITSDMADEKGLLEIRGLLGGVGLLGISCEVTFQLLHAGALAQVEIWTKDDSTLATDVKHQLQTQTPHAIYFWRPDLNFYRAHFFKPLKSGEVPVHPYYPHGTAAMLAPPPQSVAAHYWDTLAAFQEDIDDSGPVAHTLNAEVCALSSLHFPMFIDGELTDGEGRIVENGTIPTSHAMISGSDCAPNCMWTHSYFGAVTEDVEFAIKLSDLDEWVKDVKAIVQGEEEERQKHLDRRYGEGNVKACMTPGVFWLRFGRSSENLLSINTGMDEPVLYAMSLFYQSVLVPNAPPKHDHITEVIEQLTTCKYKARAHWGKSFDRQFTNEHCPVIDNFPKQNLVEMRKLQEQHDPKRVFESELLTRVLEKRGPVYEDKCSLTHKCYCKQDSHCADRFKCQPSVVFPEYRVCKVQFSHKESTEAKDEL